MAAFQARLIMRDVNTFGLGFVYTVLFTDGTTGHLYSQQGRLTGAVGTPTAQWTKLPTAQDDVRFQAPSDAALQKALADHVAQFNAVAASVAAPTLPEGQGAAFLDLSAFVPPTPPTPTPEQLAQQKYSRAIGLAQQLKVAVDVGLIPPDDALVSAAQKAATEALSAIKADLSAQVGQ